MTNGVVTEKKRATDYSYRHKYVSHVTESSILIEGFFPKEHLVKEMAIKKINKTLCIILGAVILLAAISYYFVMSNEQKLNQLSHQTMMLRDENAELQNKLDKLKSFNNVDKAIKKNTQLQKASTVIETPEVAAVSTKKQNKTVKKAFAFNVGY